MEERMSAAVILGERTKLIYDSFEEHRGLLRLISLAVADITIRLVNIEDKINALTKSSSNLT